MALNTISSKYLITQFVKYIREDHAALFIGAGLSREAGCVDWKGLLKDCAKKLKLDLTQEHDLVAVAQYYLNLTPINRERLSKILVKEFGRRGVETKNHEIISQMPISTIWTTNFDSLIENTFRKAGKIVDLKIKDSSIARTKAHRDVTIYKMHGDIATPDEVIICKDDYERYARKHEVFQSTLQGDLLTKNFLFLGFSFTDPNLDYMLGHLRSLLEDSNRERFTIMKKVHRSDYAKGAKGQERFEYDLNKQRLRVRDLLRYNIKTCLIDSYSEITEILYSIKEAINQKNIFISGSMNITETNEKEISKFCFELGEALITKNYNLVSGYGLGIGSSILSGALNKIYEKKNKDVYRRIYLHPFPLQLSSRQIQDYRKGIISGSGFVVFIYGSKKDEVVAKGVLEEFGIAKDLNKIPIPLGSTGYASEVIWKELNKNLSIYKRKVPRSLFNKLNDKSLGWKDRIRVILEIIDKFQLN